MTEIPTTHWTQKITTLFHRFDKDQDGYLTEADIVTQADEFCKNGYIRQEDAAKIKEKYVDLWKLFLQGKEKADVNDFVQGHIPLIKSKEFGTMMWNEKLSNAGSLMFKVADENQTGAITAREYGVFLRCLGVQNEECAKEIFAKFDKSNNETLTEDEFIEVFRGFVFNQEDSPSKELMGPLI